VAPQLDLAVCDPPVSDSPSPESGLSSQSVSLPSEVAPSARKDRWANGVDWVSMAWLALLHGGALLAPFFFTWKAVGITLFLGWLTGGIGICLGFHRLLTHSSFQTPKAVRWFLAWVGGLAGEGPALTWVAVHRKHHVFSDQEGDPHSPRDGAWWSHVWWLAPKRTKADEQELYARYAPDLLRDPVIRFLDKTFIVWHFAMTGALYAIGHFGWDSYTGWSFVLWGQFLRLIYVLHSTWFVNSATHMWGYRNYQTTDDSRNLWWVALLSYGEGWHNNHHAFQRMARHGHKWWEIDMTYWVILAMEKVGLARNVIHSTASHRRASGQ
jgi:stearoyl-CoA desaturase (delta-9 desaturase)